MINSELKILNKYVCHFFYRRISRVESKVTIFRGKKKKKIGLRNKIQAVILIILGRNKAVFLGWQWFSSQGDISASKSSWKKGIEMFNLVASPPQKKSKHSFFIMCIFLEHFDELLDHFSEIFSGNRMKINAYIGISVFNISDELTAFLG